MDGWRCPIPSRSANQQRDLNLVSGKPSVIAAKTAIETFRDEDPVIWGKEDLVAETLPSESTETGTDQGRWVGKVSFDLGPQIDEEILLAP
jgi:hypothetical protein